MEERREEAKQGHERESLRKSSLEEEWLSGGKGAMLFIMDTFNQALETGCLAISHCDGPHLWIWSSSLLV